MKFGVTLPYGAGVAADPEWLRSFVAAAESSGFESVYVVEHVVMVSAHDERYPYAESGKVPLASDCPIADPLDVLAFLAATTSKIRLGTSVLVAPLHHPLVLAKRLATIDQLSGGRLIAGLGVGWMREEMESVGVDFATRGRRTDELIEAVRVAWADSPASYRGEFFSFAGTNTFPKPIQTPGVPIHIGGHSSAAAKRAGRLGDGFVPLGLHGADLAKALGEMREAAERAGRDPDAIEVSLRGSLTAIDHEAIDALRAMGAHRVILSPATADLDQLAEHLWAVNALMGLVD
ncbi:MAG: LLM class F420-dependent oxidoreductase [Actinobacteria bacterium]|nr:LLM class F420-dependent oxidoreductase [Actinomycetota bacterium]